MNPQVLGTIREFKTAQFRVVVDALEDYDMDLSFDETGEVREKLESGEFIGFCARVRVLHDTLGEVSSDYLGSCIYSSLEEFEDHRECGKETRRLREQGSSAICGSYFSDMIREAVSSARKAIQGAQNIYVRA